jgi:hypothetical protein
MKEERMRLPLRMPNQKRALLLRRNLSSMKNQLNQKKKDQQLKNKCAAAASADAKAKRINHIPAVVASQSSADLCSSEF